jgi:hypothetical protein
MKIIVADFESLAVSVGGEGPSWLTRRIERRFAQICALWHRDHKADDVVKIFAAERKLACGVKSNRGAE